jgi:transposase-like protein
MLCHRNVKVWYGAAVVSIARQTDVVDRAELRGWIEDALARHDRDVRERDEVVANVTAAEIVDAVWGRLPLAVRRKATRAEVQASVTMLTLRRGIAMMRNDVEAPAAIE